MQSRTKQRRSFRFRFSLRALLILTLVIGCAISWLNSHTRARVRQQQAVQGVRERGGHAFYQYQNIKGQSKPPMPPQYLRPLMGDVIWSDVIKVSLHAHSGNEANTEMLPDLPMLQDLRLNARQLGDDAIQPIAKLVNLRRLDLWCPQVTDRALRYLGGLNQLRQLDLATTQVTDDGLQHLRLLQNLEVLKLRGTLVTPHGAAELQKALPNCKIHGVHDWQP